MDSDEAFRIGADDGTRTRDPHLGKVMLYQLSHVRVSREHSRGLTAAAGSSAAADLARILSR
jgi:hypothetical protein